jgi:surface polysaccharide O-acyltransferase-like enzyme
MLGVLINHTLQNGYELHTTNITIPNEIRIMLLNISIIAVNCFVLISGYFGIKREWEGFIRVAIEVFFYTTILSVIGYQCNNISLVECVTRIIFPLTEGHMWFIPAYLCLFLFAPIINSAFENFTLNQRLYSLIALLIIDIYVGYIHQSPEVTLDGYHLVHFITLYYIGRSIKYKVLNISRLCNLGGVILIVVLMTALHALKMIFPPIAVIYSLRYNSPMVLLCSIVFFFWAMKWTIQSNVINKIALSVFSVYIIQSQPFVSTSFYGKIKEITAIGLTPIVEIIYVVGLVITLYIGCIVIDTLRRYITTPLEYRLVSICSNLSTQLKNKIVE